MLHMDAFASLVRVLAGVTSMRRIVAIASILLLGTGPAAHARVDAKGAAGSATFVVTGHGWGHGVGMSQYGAYGYAQKGVGYAKIVLHYFPGTELGDAPVSKVRVLMTSGVSTLPVGSASDFRVKDGTGAVHDVTAGKYTLTLVCDGGGKAFLAVRSGGKAITDLGAACYSTRESVKITLPEAGPLELSVSSVDAPLIYAYQLVTAG